MMKAFVIAEGTEIDLRLPYDRIEWFLSAFGRLLCNEISFCSQFDESLVHAKVMPYVERIPVSESKNVLFIKARFDPNFNPTLEDLNQIDRVGRDNLIYILWCAGKYESASQIFEIRKQELLCAGRKLADEFHSVFLSRYDEWLTEKCS